MIYEFIYHNYLAGVTFWPLFAITAVFVVLLVVFAAKQEGDAAFSIIAGGAAGYLSPAVMLICEKSEQINSHRGEAFTVCLIAEIILLLLGVIGSNKPFLSIFTAFGNYSACFFAGLTCLTFSRFIGTFVFIILVICLVIFSFTASAGGTEETSESSGIAVPQVFIEPVGVLTLDTDDIENVRSVVDSAGNKYILGTDGYWRDKNGTACDKLDEDRFGFAGAMSLGINEVSEQHRY
ncbi:MAG: hypothetical protein IKD87_07050 [Oscillospiraceae bacterium]|nr:hypothetical protein [Oscillospiraceae bacterium]